MRTKLLMAVLSIGIVTLASINAYAWPGDYVAHADEKALDLSKPENIARLTGTWEGTWKNIRSGVRGEILQRYAFDSKDEEKPVSIQTKRRPAGILGTPEKWGSSRGNIERGKVELRGLRSDTTYTLYERTDGTLVLRGHTQGVGDNQSSELMSEQYKLAEGQAYKFFPPEKQAMGPRAAER